MLKIGFIGAGNIAGAIMKGLHENNFEHEIFASDIDEAKVLALAEYGVKPQATEQMVKTCDYIVLAVKPQNFAQLLDEIAGSINKNTVIISIAAGITAEFIKNKLDYDAKIVLVMPNTPILLGKGATAISKVAPTSEVEFYFAKQIFASSGYITEIEAEKMNYIIPINSSAPAFIYEFAKHFVEFGVGKGFTEKQSIDMFCATLVGAAGMMKNSNDLDKLIEMVSSKGGTTVAGLGVFREKDFGGIIKEACETCAKRAFELSK